MNFLNILNKSFQINQKKLLKLISTQNVCNYCHKSSENKLTFNDFKCLAINKRIETKIKIILSEFLSLRADEENKSSVPSTLTVNQMKDLVNIQKIEKNGRIWRDVSAKDRRHLLYLMKRSEDSDGWNRLTRPLLPNEFEKFYSNRLKNSILFGQNVVFDLSFDKHMSILECKNLAEQLHRIYRFNRYDTLKISDEELPFALNFCNVSPDEKTFKFMDFLYPHMLCDQSFITVTQKSYLDLFPKQDLIYLSPHADQVLTEYDSNAVFIIGGIVDRKEVLTLSQPKAVQQNIRSMRLPIDPILREAKQNNVQSLDAVFRILFDFKAFGVFNENMKLEERVRKYLPKRKLKSDPQLIYERLNSGVLSELSFEEEFIEDFEENILNEWKRTEN